MVSALLPAHWAGLAVLSQAAGPEHWPPPARCSGPWRQGQVPCDITKKNSSGLKGNDRQDRLSCGPSKLCLVLFHWNRREAPIHSTQSRSVQQKKSRRPLSHGQLFIWGKTSGWLHSSLLFSVSCIYTKINRIFLLPFIYSVLVCCAPTEAVLPGARALQTWPLPSWTWAFSLAFLWRVALGEGSL